MSPVALGSPVSCLASQSVTAATHWGLFHGKATAFVVKKKKKNQHVNVTAQGSPSPSPVYTIVTHHILKWILWFVWMLSA